MILFILSGGNKQTYKKTDKIITNKRTLILQVIQNSPVSGKPSQYLQNTAAQPGGNKCEMVILQLESC